jgi:hypothetical protein
MKANEGFYYELAIVLLLAFLVVFARIAVAFLY